MSTEKEFVSGLIVKAPNDNAPEYVKAKLSIRREELIAWLQSRDGEWVNADVKVSQGGKWYAQVDDWKPNSGGTTRAPAQSRPQRAESGRMQEQQSTADFGDFNDDDIPFATNRGTF